MWSKHEPRAAASSPSNCLTPSRCRNHTGWRIDRKCVKTSRRRPQKTPRRDRDTKLAAPFSLRVLTLIYSCKTLLKLNPSEPQSTLEKEMSVETITSSCAPRTPLTAADESTSNAIFPRLEFMKAHSHLSPAVFFCSVIPQENSHHQALSNKSIFILIGQRVGSWLQEMQTAPGGMMQSPRFRPTGKTESIAVF